MRILLFVLVTLALNSCGGAKQGEKKTGGMDPLTVDVQVLSPRSFSHTFSYNGNILAGESIDLKPEISGRITRIAFVEGQRVEKGDLLVKINDNDLQAQLKKVILQIELAEKDDSRKRELLKINGVSQEEFDIAQNQLNTLLAEKDILLAQIAKTEIRAAFRGTIGLRYYSEGAFVSAGTMIAGLHQTDPIKIEFSIPERYRSMLSVNDNIYFNTESSNKALQAKIYAIEPNIESSTRSVRVRAIANNNNGHLIPGSFIKVNLSLTKSSKSIVIPAKSVVPVIDGDKVFVLKNGSIESRKIEIGIRTSDEVEIEEGLHPNDTIIVSGLLMVKDGMKVNIRMTKATNNEGQ